jgi:hypothetical protein
MNGRITHDLNSFVLLFPKLALRKDQEHIFPVNIARQKAFDTAKLDVQTCPLLTLYFKLQLVS